jgi:hypothetical protein
LHYVANSSVPPLGEWSAIQKEFRLKLALVRVTTRIVLRGKKAVKLSPEIVNATFTAIAVAVVLSCESFTGCFHPHFDNSSFRRIAPIFVEVLLQHN